ncbi:glycosyl hydrolase family 95 catalytic domain-containing protein [Herbidospora mongoliensis]|uniref:glycosyl hydrolase family 95 catalytic domain-containing protein n=1 Tax=Herbidospora mongoliensis TaxID=688067 RepID=UPI00082AE7C0|nr:glycoside hydrolase N-terminal domain-containing protein [Herbidospora mongoliensis]
MSHPPRRLLGAATALGLVMALGVPVLQGSTATAQVQEAAAAQDDLTLWYDKPATNWESQALPIGNGALGAMIFGGVGTEQIQFNEKSLWTGGPGSSGYNFGNWTTPRPTAIADVQALIDTNKQMTPAQVAQRLGQGKTNFGSYQTFGDMFLDFPGAPANPTDYKRSLNLNDAVAAVTYKDGDVTYKREYFASYPNNVIVGRISSDAAGKVNFTVRHTSPRNDKTVSVSKGRMTIRGKLANNGLNFESQVNVVAEGGARTDGTDRITVSNANAAWFVISAGTDYSMQYPTYRTEDPHDNVRHWANWASSMSYAALKQAHLDDYHGLFDRVKLNLGGQIPNLPTDQLRAAYAGAGAAQDRFLENLFYQYGRYLLISSSREGSLPANLQGVWNNVTNPPWDADYHVNINLQMNYWLAEQTNLAETTIPYDEYISSMVAPGTKTATDMYNARGWVVNNETNPWGFTGLHNYPESFWFPEAAAWNTQQMYDHYKFSNDEKYLKRTAYPVMKGAAEFWLDFLHTDPRDGKLVVSPSYSPENGQFTAGASMSQQIVTELLTNTLNAAKTLKVDPALQAELTNALAKLDPGIRIGSWGQLQEWKEDLDNPNNDHRHVSHLFGVHPGNVIKAGTPEGEAAKISLTARGDGGTGWSKAWKVNFWARLLDGDHSHKMLSEQLKSSTLSNLFDTHPPFQIDGNFGATSGMTEMLLQSHQDSIHILPALPAVWKNGSVTGLRARGNATVDIDWSNSSLTKAVIKAGDTGELTVRAGAVNARYSFVDDQGNPVDAIRNGDALTFGAEKGRMYTLYNEIQLAVSAPAEIGAGQTVPVKATVSAIQNPSPAGTLTLQLPTGWTADPASTSVASVPAGESREITVNVTAGPSNGQTSARIQATLAGSGWSISAATGAALNPCAVPPADRAIVAWDPQSGSAIADASGSGRNAVVVNGTPAYDTDGGLILSGQNYVRTEQPTTLGFLREATFAAEVKIAGTGYRRLFDSQPSGNPGTDGILIDVTPESRLRVIGAGNGVTTNATLPTGRYIDLVVTINRNGAIDVYVDGVRAGGGNTGSSGIYGCNTRPLFFAANQGGNERMTGAVDRMAVLPYALPANQVSTWQDIAF